MRSFKLFLSSVAVAMLVGCTAHRSPSAAPALHTAASLEARANSGWRAAQEERLRRFKKSENATLWEVAQDLHRRVSAGWPPPAAPIRLGEFEYFSEDEPGLRYPIFRRRNGTAPPETVLDLNREFPNGRVDIGLLRLSPDNHHLAVTLDVDGSGTFKLFTRLLPEGDLRGPLADSVHEAEWGTAGSLLFSTLEGLRATHLIRHRPGMPNESILLPVGTDGHLALHSTGTGTTIVRELSPRGTRVWKVAAAESKIQPTEIAAPKQMTKTTVFDACLFDAGALLITERASIRTLIWVPAKRGAQPAPVNLAGAAGTIEGIRCFIRDAIVFGQAEDRGALWHVTLENKSPRPSRVTIPRGLTALSLGAHPTPAAEVVRVQMSSLINPPLLYELDLKSGAFAPRAQMAVAHHVANEYTTAPFSARASDGSIIPITVAYSLKEGAPGSRPVILTTYGAYGMKADTGFDPFYLPFLERGFIVAVAHVRGGGEKGPEWHTASRGKTKVVGTTDLIAAAEALLKLGWGEGKRIALMGRSAGAIPVAGAAALRPDLFGAVVLDAPFLDITGALSDPTRPLAIRDRTEWGDPNDAASRAGMRAYAPFDLPVGADYPPTLITVGSNDSTVPPMDGARWLAHLESYGSYGHLISISSGTHSGPPTRTEAANEAALRAAFVVATLRHRK
jgi:oligopeptidase B